MCLFLSACTALSAPTTAPKSTKPPSGPTSSLTIEQAQQTAGDFLNAWSMGNYEGMYQLLHIKSRDAIPLLEFIASYRDAEALITVNGPKKYQFLNAFADKNAAQVAYQMTFNTQAFGSFTDTNRMLNLEATADGWRVAWTPGDIFDEMRDGAILFVDRESPNRGNIYDRNGVALADQGGTRIVVTLLTEKYPTDNPDACFAELGRVFPARSAARLKEVYAPFTGKPQGYVVGELNDSRFAAEKPVLEKVCALQYESLPTRRYPLGGLAPHVVGHVGHIPAEQVAAYVAKGYSPDALVGVEGIERDWEDVLAGRSAATLTLRKGGTILRRLATSPAVAPQSVYLTIDANLQNALQNALKEAWSSSSAYFYTSKGGAALIMDIKSGEILAMASYPDFDLNLFNPVTASPDAPTQLAALLTDPRKPLLNRATLGAYPLGSVFKIVSMVAAADSGQFNMGSLVTCTGVWDGAKLGDRYRTDWIHSSPPYQHGTLNLKQALTGSCDPYFWTIGWRLNGVDQDILPNYAREFGFGALTGIRGVSETAGQIPNPDTYPATYGKRWTGSDALDFVIGQGTMLVTPLQVVRMVTAVADDGTLWEPLIVQKTGQIGQINYVAKPTSQSKLPFKPDVLAGVREAMCKVTTDRTLGTATFVFQGFKGAVVCGKTGTAESGQANPHAWFAAYAGKAADQPEIALVALVENSYEGSYVAAPIVRHMVEVYFNLPVAPWPAWYGTQSISTGSANSLATPTAPAPRNAP
jgi:penicillin-binding protein 2